MSDSHPVSADQKQLIDQFWQRVAAIPATMGAETIQEFLRSGTTDPVFSELGKRLTAIQQGLVLTVDGGVDPTVRPDLVISADGNASLFELVHAVVDRVPSAVAERWHVRALRPAQPSEHAQIMFEGVELAVRNIRHVATRDGVRINVALFVPGITDTVGLESPSNERYAQAAFILLDHMLGEWATTSVLGELTWMPIEAAPAGASPLIELVGDVDALLSSDDFTFDPNRPLAPPPPTSNMQAGALAVVVGDNGVVQALVFTPNESYFDSGVFTMYSAALDILASLAPEIPAGVHLYTVVDDEELIDALLRGSESGPSDNGFPRNRGTFALYQPMDKRMFVDALANIGEPFFRVEKRSDTSMVLTVYMKGGSDEEDVAMGFTVMGHSVTPLPETPERAADMRAWLSSLANGGQ